MLGGSPGTVSRLGTVSWHRLMAPSQRPEVTCAGPTQDLLRADGWTLQPRAPSENEARGRLRRDSLAGAEAGLSGVWSRFERRVEGRS